MQSTQGKKKKRASIKTISRSNEGADAYRDRLRAREDEQPEAYQSRYGERIDRLLDERLKREPFSYDAQDDPMYKQYGDAYTLAGRRAMQDAAGQAAALTGGYGSSYGAQAAAQAYNEHMTKLSGVLPQLEGRAYERYRDEDARTARDLELSMELEGTDYDRYRDRVGDRRDELDYYAARYGDVLEDEREDDRLREDDRRWQTEFDRLLALDERERLRDEAPKDRSDEYLRRALSLLEGQGGDKAEAYLKLLLDKGLIDGDAYELLRASVGLAPGTGGGAPGLPPSPGGSRFYLRAGERA